MPQQISLNDFSIHRIIGRGGFGEVYGCRKDDTGKMYVYVILLAVGEYTIPIIFDDWSDGLTAVC